MGEVTQEIRKEVLNPKLPLSSVGLLIGTLFFAFSLSPSLLPRPYTVQGALSGLSFSAGYGLGVALTALWHYLQLPEAGPPGARLIRRIAGVLSILTVVSFLWQASTWQNSIRELMGMDPSEGVRPALLGLIALLVFVVVLGVARIFRWTFRFLAARLRRFVPPRISYLVGIMAATWLFWAVIDGVLIQWALRTSDESFQQLDTLIQPDLPLPGRPEQTGSAASLIGWEGLGRQGRNFVAGAPTAAELSAFSGTPVPDPIRVYVGLNSAETPQERAALALRELQRVGGFDRSVLLLVTPTGTGWVDPASQNTVEYLLRGDVATVAAQYSYLSSPLALMTEGAYGAETARALFEAVYGYWRTLPRGARPRLYLHGLSLGALNSDRSFDFFDIIDDPFDGAFWVGPPFRHETWQEVTRQRDPGSPAWRPRFGGGAVVRFMNQDGGLRQGVVPWGSFRIAFLQYASDPITFFDPQAYWREPGWIEEPRAPDVVPQLRWFPVVTMLQLSADMMVGTAPPGFGHEYAASHYLDAWLALLEPGGWSGAEVERLRGVVE